MMQFILRPMRHWYFRSSYQPQPLDERPGSYPNQSRITKATWFSTPVPACVSTSLQMIADYFEIQTSRQVLDFLMGFTYGAGDLPGIGYMPVGTDPEVGFREAAPYIGLRCRYFTTDNSALFIEAIKFQISHGNPVWMPLDMGVLYGVDELIPHSEVVIGYDRESFEYYEPVCTKPAPCQHKDHLAGEKGLFTTRNRLLEAAENLTAAFDYPWRYAFSIFEPGTISRDFRLIWQRNGSNLIGGRRMGMRWGAAATEQFAAHLESGDEDLDYERLGLVMEIGAFMRSENAGFLKENYSKNRELMIASDLFERSASCFFQVREPMSQGISSAKDTKAAAEKLREAAKAERKAGEIFLNADEEITLARNQQIEVS